MAFKKLIISAGPRKKPDEIRTSFTGIENASTCIYISTKILIENGWPIEGRVFIYVDDEDKDILMIEKCEEEHENSYGSIKLNKGKNQNASKIQFKIKGNEGKEKENKSVKYEVKDGRFIIYNKRKMIKNNKFSTYHPEGCR